MKRLSIFAMAALLSSSLGGCFSRSSESVPDISLPPPVLSVYENAQSSAEELHQIYLEDPNTTTAQALITQANEYYGWTALATMPHTENFVIIPDSQGGPDRYYYEIDRTLFSTMRGLRRFYTNIFDESIVDALLHDDVSLKEIDGVLYQRKAEQSAESRIESVEYETVLVQAGRAELSAEVTYRPGSETPQSPKTYRYILEKRDGHWVFVSFTFLY